MPRILAALSLLILVTACATPTVSPTPVVSLETAVASPIAPAPSPASETNTPPAASLPTVTSISGPLATAPASATLPRVEGKTPSLSGRIRLSNLAGAGRRPTALARLGQQVYVTGLDSNNLAVIENNVVSGFIPVGKGPDALAVDEPNVRLYVGSGEARQVALVSAGRVVNSQVLSD